MNQVEYLSKALDIVGDSVNGDKSLSETKKHDLFKIGAWIIKKIIQLYIGHYCPDFNHTLLTDEAGIKSYERIYIQDSLHLTDGYYEHYEFSSNMFIATLVDAYNILTERKIKKAIGDDEMEEIPEDWIKKGENDGNEQNSKCRG